MTKGNSGQSPATRTQSRGQASSGLDRVREEAGRDKHLRFTNLMHHVTVDLLRKSYFALKRNAAPGVDGVTWHEYGEDLEARLPDLNDRVQSGRYRAKPSRRTWIPKADGRQRPLGIAALEDKIVQQAMVMVLSSIYEEDILGFSYSFRPGRGPHNALDALWVGITQQKVNWVLDLDIRSFFDTIDHEWLMKFVEHRIADRRVLRLIRKWLRAGVSEDGEWSKTMVGTPQGSVISPLLANVYLYYVLDQWVQAWRKRRVRGDVIVVRYADDAVLGFQYRDEAESFLQELRERVAKFGLEIHQDKTRLIEFGRFAAKRRAERGEGKPEMFDFLGFTHICAKRRSNGTFIVQRKTIAKRLRAKAKEVKGTLMRNRHKPVPEQGRWLRSVVRGFFNYYAVPGNRRALQSFRTHVNRMWLRALRRRSQRGQCLNWRRMKRLIQTWIPSVRILHPYPNQRLRVSYPR
ncbi:MAG: group II intron reverse transcriptase/maturase [Candidatus Eisenbacteria sp.]|nr:group II intron reverse transcriptase/maturase [Candidatus Eisenbacteria bacterium]